VHSASARCEEAVRRTGAMRSLIPILLCNILFEFVTLSFPGFYLFELRIFIGAVPGAAAALFARAVFAHYNEVVATRVSAVRVTV